MSAISNYKQALSRIRDAAADEIERPPPGNYDVALLGLTIKDGDFSWRKPSEGKVPAKCFCATFQLLNDPSDSALKFPGRFWAIPLTDVVDEKTGEKMPKNQLKRMEIQDGQFKSWYKGLLGEEPDDPFTALENLAQWVEGTGADDPLRFRIQIKNRKDEPDRFEREVITRQI